MAGTPEFKGGTPEGKRAMPDLAVLDRGARLPFRVSDAAEVTWKLFQTPYTGVLQSLHDVLGSSMRSAPGLVVLDEGNSNRFATLQKEGFQFRLPKEDEKRVLFDPTENLLLALPHDATWDKVAQASTKAWVHDVSRQSITQPDALWRPVRDHQRKRRSFPPERIPAVLGKEIMVTGLSKWVALATQPPAEEAQARIAAFLPQDTVTRDRLLQDKLDNVRRAAEMLEQAEMEPSDGVMSAILQSKYNTAYGLVQDASELVGVYYIDSILHTIDDIIKPAEDEEGQRRQRGRWIDQIILKPPEKVGEFLIPHLFFSRPTPDAPDPKEDDVPRSRFIGGTKRMPRYAQGRRVETVSLNDPYPFSDTTYSIHMSETQTVHDPEPGGNRQLEEVPFYYHDPLSPSLSALITPRVISRFAEIMGEEYPEGTADRINVVLFDPFVQMDADPSRRIGGSESEEFAQWREARLRFIRYSSSLPNRTVDVYTGITIQAVQRNLRSARGESEENQIFEKNSVRNQEGDVGITVESMMSALFTDAVRGHQSILPDQLDQEFLQTLGNFIIQGTLANQELQASRTDVRRSNSQTEEVVVAVPSVEVTAEALPFGSLPYVESPRFTREEIPGFGRVYVVASENQIDPIITPHLLTEYSASSGTDITRELFEQVNQVLFLPFEEVRNSLSDSTTREDLPEFFRQWLPIAKKLGLVLFPVTDASGESHIQYGYRESIFHGAFEGNLGNMFSELIGLTEESRRYLTSALSQLEAGFTDEVRKSVLDY